MDLQTKKMLFIEQFLTISNESLVDKLNAVLKKEWTKDTSEEVSEEYKKFIDGRISAHQNDPTGGLTWEEFQNKIEGSL